MFKWIFSMGVPKREFHIGHLHFKFERFKGRFSFGKARMDEFEILQ